MTLKCHRQSCIETPNLYLKMSHFVLLMEAALLPVNEFRNQIISNNQQIPKIYSCKISIFERINVKRKTATKKIIRISEQIKKSNIPNPVSLSAKQQIG